MQLSFLKNFYNLKTQIESEYLGSNELTHDFIFPMTISTLKDYNNYAANRHMIDWFIGQIIIRYVGIE